eukprot:3249236-Pleurochrysis_carterae.AAC.1
MSTKQREERRPPGTAVHRGVKREGDHGERQMPVALALPIHSTADCKMESEYADSLHSEPSLRSSR